METAPWLNFDRRYQKFFIKIISFFLIICTCNCNTDHSQSTLQNHLTHIEKIHHRIQSLKDKGDQNKKIIIEIISVLYRIDQESRKLLIPFVKEVNCSYAHPYFVLLKHIDYQKSKILKHLIDLNKGWFKISLFSKETDHQAWMLVQHADHNILLQENVLKILSTLYKKGETDPKNYAYLYDRIALNKGLQQRYGTQLMYDHHLKEWRPSPLQDDHTDQHRADVGLEPLNNYIKKLDEQYSKSPIH